MEIRPDHLMGPLNRRVFLFGGAAVAGTAVVAACRGAAAPVSVVPATTTTTAIVGTTKDIAILNTAISIEALLVAAYTQMVKSGLVTTATTLALLKEFETHHTQHQDLFTRTTRGSHGTPVTQANPVLMAQVVQPRLAALKAEADVLSLAYDLEHLASATYQADIGMFDHPPINATVATVGGAEARHVAVLAILSNKSATGTPDNSFQVDTDAVSPGTGV